MEGFNTREDYERYKAAERHRAVLQAIRPILNAKVRAFNCMMPKITIYPERVDRVYSAEDQAILDKFDELIRQVIDSMTKDLRMNREDGMMTEKRQMVADLAADLHDKQSRFEMMRMMNTAGLSGDELKHSTAAYNLARFDYLEARAALERAMPANKEDAAAATYEANIALVAKLRAEKAKP
jgi:hypothetical protein